MGVGRRVGHSSEVLQANLVKYNKDDRIVKDANSLLERLFTL